MTWQLWIPAGLFLMNAVFQPLTVGKERTPNTAPTAAVLSAINLLLFALILWGSRG